MVAVATYCAVVCHVGYEHEVGQPTSLQELGNKTWISLKPSLTPGSAAF